MLKAGLMNKKELGLDGFDHCQPLQTARDAKIRNSFFSRKNKTKALSGKLSLRLKLRVWL